MSWQQLPEHIRDTATSVLTKKQLVAYKLAANGMSETKIAIHLGISRRSVRDRITAADIKIHAHLKEQAA